MNTDDADTSSPMAEPPTWWDEHRVPRHGEPDPAMAASPYAKEVALLEIACQACGREFRVMTSVCLTDDWLKEEIEDGSIHYGDPPHHDGCATGYSMNCYDLRVLGYWRRVDEPAMRPRFVEVPELKRELSNLADRDAEDE